MSSSYKTQFLGLNRFVGSDKPKMDDFNFDNSQLDSRIKEHFEDSAIHVTQAEKNSWNNKANGYVMGSYIGNGASQTVSLGFNPSFGFVFAVDMPMVQYSYAGNVNGYYSGFYTKNGCSYGLTKVNNGFTVKYVSGNSMGIDKSLLNENGRTYLYVMFK